MGLTTEIVRLGASRLSASGLPIVTATDKIGDGDADTENFGEIDHFNGLGCTARPFPATPAGHAEAVGHRGVPGTTGIAVSGRDERCADMYASLAPGDTVLHATGPSHAAQLFCKEDGSVTALTTDDGTATGRSVFWQVRPDAFRGIAPWGKLTYDQGGLHVLHYSGARFDLGGIGGLPDPLNAMGTYATIAASIIKIEGSAIALGTSVGVPDAIAKSTPTGACVTAIMLALQAVGAALTAVSAATVPETSPAAAAAVTAIEAAQAAVSSALLLIPSASTTVT